MLTAMQSIIIWLCSWCGPCKKIAPYVHKKNEETKIPLVSLNVDNAEEVSATYGVSGIPHFVVIKGKWNNVINAGTGGSEGVVNGIFNHALNHK